MTGQVWRGARIKVLTGTLLVVVTVAPSQHIQAVSAIKAKAARYTAKGNRGLDVRSEALARQAIEEMTRQIQIGLPDRTPMSRLVSRKRFKTTGK